MNKLKLVLAFGLLGVLWSCGKHDAAEDFPAIGTEYYPLNIGRTWVYSIDSVAYDDNGPVQNIDTFYYQYKEVIADTATDDMGRLYCIVNRFYRNNDSDTWHQSRNYTAQIADNKAQKVEENTRFVKLVFPLRARNSWNGNLFNGRGSQTYRVTEFQVPYSLDGQVYNSVYIEQSNINNFIEEIRRYERYAENIGMVNLLYDSLNTQSSGTKGFRLRQNLTFFAP